MEYLFSHFNKIEELLRNKFILLFLDYDGTLTPIVETPNRAVISQEARELLQKLSGSSYCKIGIISGRSLEDIKNAVGMKDIIYAGNHGLEIEGPKIKFSRLPFDIKRDPAIAGESHAPPRSKSIIRNIVTDMQKRLSGIKGALIEDKGLTLSIHYRLVGKKDIPVLERIISEVISPYAALDKIKIDSGKKVYEIKPAVKWDKGKVILWLMARQEFAAGERKVFPVYIGDDLTDEDAFKALKKKGLTIFVGESGSSNAGYYLKNTEEVIKFLGLISKIKHN